MREHESPSGNEVLSKVLRAGRRTYFFDVRETKAGDYYLTITESKKFTNEDDTFYFKKQKLYLYKEDFSSFKEYLDEAMNYILREKGEDVIPGGGGKSSEDGLGLSNLDFESLS